MQETTKIKNKFYYRFMEFVFQVFSTNHKFIVVTMLINFYIIYAACTCFWYHDLLSLITLLPFFFINSLILYGFIYSWRNINLSINSCFNFTFVKFELLLFCLGLTSFFRVLPNPLFIENLSLLSQYRYLFFTILGFIGIIGGIIMIAFPTSKLSLRIASLSLFSVKEEIRVVLSTFEFVKESCSRLLDFLYVNHIFKVLFFSVNFIIFCVSRLFISILFINFVFLHGDLRILINFIPLTFVIWILSFIQHIFFGFVEDTEKYILSLIIAQAPENSSFVFNFLKIENSSNIIFELSTKGIEDGFTDVDLPLLIKEWFVHATLSPYFGSYRMIVRYFHIINFSIRFVCWFFIAIIFFINPKDITSFLAGGNPLIVVATRTWTSSNVHTRSYATAIYRVKKQHQTDLENATQGVHKKYHFAAADLAIKNPKNPKEVFYAGQPTHGKGGPSTPSVPLHPSTDIQGNNRPQNIVPAKGLTFVKPHFFQKKPIKGSENYCQDPIVKAVLDKVSPKPSVSNSSTSSTPSSTFSTSTPSTSSSRSTAISSNINSSGSSSSD